MLARSPLRSSLVLAGLLVLLGACDAGDVSGLDAGPDARADVVFPDADADADADPDADPGADADAPVEPDTADDAPADTAEATDAADAADDDATDVPDGSPDDVPDGSPDGSSDTVDTDTPETTPACSPNGDGVLTAAEVPVMVGAVVSYRVSPADQVVTVPDLAGTPCPAGLCWDLSAPVTGDTVEADPVRPVSELWFAASFPADAVVVPLDARTGDLAVYQKTDAAFLMLGMASAEPDWTALVYDPPVTILAFPFQKGSTWTTKEAHADGLFEGSVYPDLYGNHVVHTYEFVVNGRGEVTVPAGTFQALRLLLDLTMEARNAFGIPYNIPGLAEPTHVKVYDFLAECVGLVARVRSTEGELATFFHDATEYKRLGF